MNQRTSQLCASHPFLLRVLTVAEVYRGKGVSYLCGTCHKSDTLKEKKEDWRDCPLVGEKIHAPGFTAHTQCHGEGGRLGEREGGDAQNVERYEKHSGERCVRECDTANFKRTQDILWKRPGL